MAYAASQKPDPVEERIRRQCANASVSSARVKLSTTKKFVPSNAGRIGHARPSRGGSAPTAARYWANGSEAI
jgi:hypothetical protein